MARNSSLRQAARYRQKAVERNDAVKSVKEKIKAEYLAIDPKTLKPTNDPFHVALAISVVEEKLIREHDPQRQAAPTAAITKPFARFT